jgi:hypothetical protein
MIGALIVLRILDPQTGTIGPTLLAAEGFAALDGDAARTANFDHRNFLFQRMNEAE